MCDTGELVKLLENFVKESLDVCAAENGLDSSTFVEKVFSVFFRNNSYALPKHGNSHGGASFPKNASDTMFPDDSNESSASSINKLEMIKVVVLIIVILIILLTTCRMVFQLSTRFRPEKNNLHE